MDDKWARLEEIVERVISRQLDARGLKEKTKLAFLNGEWTGLTKEQLRAWSLAYPSCDVEKEMRLAAAWIVSNPNLAPKQQIARFMNTWLSRQQDRSAIRSIPTRSDQKVEKMTCSYCDLPRVGVVNRIPHCSAHGQDAMEEKPARAA